MANEEIGLELLDDIARRSARQHTHMSTVEVRMNETRITCSELMSNGRTKADPIPATSMTMKMSNEKGMRR